MCKGYLTLFVSRGAESVFAFSLVLVSIGALCTCNVVIRQKVVTMNSRIKLIIFIAD